MLTPSRGPAHFLPEMRYSATMAPQIGPNDAPINPKNATRFPAIPSAARIMPIVAPPSVQTSRETEGIIVERLLPMMNEQKHAGAIEPIAKSRNMIFASAGLTVLSEPANENVSSSGSIPCAPATARMASPPATRMARPMPVKPPRLTSRSLRLFMPKSTPAAPAVAKKPMTNWIIRHAPARALRSSPLGSNSPIPDAPPMAATISMISGTMGKNCETLATYWMPSAPIVAKT